MNDSHWGLAKPSGVYPMWFCNNKYLWRMDFTQNYCNEGVLPLLQVFHVIIWNGVTVLIYEKRAKRHCFKKPKWKYQPFKWQVLPQKIIFCSSGDISLLSDYLPITILFLFTFLGYRSQMLLIPTSWKAWTAFGFSTSLPANPPLSSMSAHIIRNQFYASLCMLLVLYGSDAHCNFDTMNKLGLFLKTSRSFANEKHADVCVCARANACVCA